MITLIIFAVAIAALSGAFLWGRAVGNRDSLRAYQAGWEECKRRMDAGKAPLAPLAGPRRAKTKAQAVVNATAPVPTVTIGAPNFPQAPVCMAMGTNGINFKRWKP